MQISLSDAGKRFNRDWIFRHFSYKFQSGHSYAITGPNGSGKSTLLQITAGAIAPSEGNIEYNSVGGIVEADTIFRHISIAAPYQEVIEEMTLIEFLHFHRKFKPLLKGLTVQEMIRTIHLESSADKQIRNYSSGMKQRVKLAQAFFSDTRVLLLDEPCTNLDQDGIDLYHMLIHNYTDNRIVIVSSNDKQEYGFCKEEIRMDALTMS